ncbi:MAG: DUF2087 domain-containing protein [Candidatus Izemoplasmatales bacterium]|jgi:hypothetical protein
MFTFTNREFKEITAKAFVSTEPLILKFFPAKEKRKFATLITIIQAFDPSRAYHEREVNEILKPIYHDWAIIRRYLVDYGFMSRTPDGSVYQVVRQDCKKFFESLT